MGETAQAGWYADPWREAPLRWWDGTEWTAETTGPPPFEPAAPTLGALVGAGGRVAVVDVETTGLYSADRVLEVAIVTLDASGVLVEEFETLVNPNRDVGPVWLHGVTASMVRDAPTFDDVAHHVAARLDGAVLCAHNLGFDQRMLLAELSRCAMTVDWGAGVDTLGLTGSKLEVACRDSGIELTGAHRALHDARATAQLLTVHAAAVDDLLVPATVGPHSVRPIRVLTRTGTTQADVQAPFLATLAGSLHAEPDLAPYEDLLAVAVADLKLTPDERDELAALADDLGLDATRRSRAHRDFVSQLVDAAVEDHVVTAEEYEQLCCAAALLDVGVELVDQRTEGLRSTPTTLPLTPGLSVCFTGTALDDHGDEIPRDQLSAVALSAGLSPTGSVTKDTGLLVAADPASRSGKAAKARKNGTPIAGAAAFLAAVRSGEPLEASVMSSPGVALVCGTCGDSWLAPRRQAEPRCAACKAAATPALRQPVRSVASPASAAESTPVLETLECATCGTTWQRPRVRGRKPRHCPDCA